MKIKKLIWPSLLCILFVANANAAGIPPLPDVDAATAAAHPELASRREALAQERETLRSKSMKQKGACSEVEEGTPAETDCAAWLGRITNEVDLHIQSTNDLAAAISAAAGYKAFSFPSIKVRGEVVFFTADGRKFEGEDVTGVSIDNRTKIVTGKNSRAYMILPDGTSFTVGANSEMVLDDFVYDPRTGIQKFSIKLAKGAFRWVTGKVTRRPRMHPEVVTPVGALGFRGTDFECSFKKSGDGFIKLYSGDFEFTDKKTGAVMTLVGGNLLTFKSGKMIGPELT